MATFTVDLLTGNLYLFSGDFTGSGSTPTTGSTYPQVNLYSDLPTPASSYGGQIYVVKASSGSYVLNRKEAGLYLSVANTWRRLGDIPSFFKSDNFQIYDNIDTSKGLSFVTSGVSTGVFRKLTIQNSDGTIAYLTDLNTKVDKTAFADYTGTTAPATYLNKSIFNVFTGTTLPANYYNKTQINAYTGATLLLINAKQDPIIAGHNIFISGTTINVSLPVALQLLDTSGGTEMNNIPATPIIWNSMEFSGTSLLFTGGSRIYVQETDHYKISYVTNIVNQDASAKVVGMLLRKNGVDAFTPLTSSAYAINTVLSTGTNVMPPFTTFLQTGDYIELVGFRIGYAGSVKTKANGSWLRILKTRNNEGG
jgi:hypothetical protein